MIPYQHIGLQKIKEINAEACDFQNLLAIHHAEQDVGNTPYDHLFKRQDSKAEEDFFNYALILQCSLASNGVLRAHATFDESIIDSSQMQRLLCQLEHVIRQLGSGEGGKTVQEMNLIAPEDLELIRSWNTKPDIPNKLPFEAIQRYFDIRPEATAVCSWDGQLSYSELNKLSSRLADQLTTKYGIGPESIVPVCFDRSKWMIIAVIAVMRAGGAFTLLGPTYPHERLQRIVEIIDSKIVLVSASRISMFTKHVVVDDQVFESMNLSNTTTTEQQANLTVENAMYVVFTSGSTGGT